jgi:hypothetical protein
MEPPVGACSQFPRGSNESSSTMCRSMPSRRTLFRCETVRCDGASPSTDGFLLTDFMGRMEGWNMDHQVWFQNRKAFWIRHTGTECMFRAHHERCIVILNANILTGPRISTTHAVTLSPAMSFFKTVALMPCYESVTLSVGWTTTASSASYKEMVEEEMLSLLDLHCKDANVTFNPRRHRFGKLGSSETICKIHMD